MWRRVKCPVLARKWENITHRYGINFLKQGSDQNVVHSLSIILYTEFGKKVDMPSEDWKAEVQKIAETRRDWHRYIPLEAECCFRCRYMSWNVALGAGIRCIIDKGGRTGSQIKGLMENCDSFEFKRSIKGRVQGND
jgi:hypothetical protein